MYQPGIPSAVTYSVTNRQLGTPFRPNQPGMHLTTATARPVQTVQSVQTVTYQTVPYSHYPNTQHSYVAQPAPPNVTYVYPAHQQQQVQLY